MGCFSWVQSMVAVMPSWLLCCMTWRRNQMETCSALLALCAGYSPVTGEFPAQRPVTWSFDIFFDLRLNKQLSKQLWGWSFEMPSWSLWRHCNEISSGIQDCWRSISPKVESTIIQSQPNFSRSYSFVPGFVNMQMWHCIRYHCHCSYIYAHSHDVWNKTFHVIDTEKLHELAWIKSSLISHMGI